MRYVSLFSGIEAASVAWKPLGWEPVAFSEIDPFCCEVLRQRFPGVPNLGDITTIDWGSFNERIDLVVGGSPCQSFSFAGKREGLAGESGLMYEYIRAVRELRPRVFVWENVPGALSSERGEAFRQLLSEMDDLGYGLAWRVLDAQFFGVPQRRRRVFLVGCIGDARSAAEILFNSEELFWNPTPSRQKRQELTDANRFCAGGCNSSRAAGAGFCKYDTLVFDTTQITSPQNGSNPQFGDPCHPLCASMHVPTVIVPSTHTFCTRKSTIAFCGQASSGASSVGAAWELAPTLRAGSCGLSAPVICVASGQANAEIEHDFCPTITARQHKDPPILIARNALDEVCAPSICPNVWRWPWIIRRLTPLECERLQGFPDEWTRIPYKGKPLGACPDSPRYSALGNSMAVPVMHWIGNRVDEVLS